MAVSALSSPSFFQPISHETDLAKELVHATEALTDNQAGWEKHAEKLTKPSRRLFLGFLKGMFQSSLAELHQMVLKGCSVQEFREAAKNAFEHTNNTAESFLRNRAVYKEKKEKVAYRLDQFDQTLQKSELSFASFTPFSEPSFHPSSHHTKNVQSILKNWTNGKLAHHLHHLKGSLHAHTFEIIANVMLTPKPEDSSSPYRDLVVSSSVHAGLSAAVQTLLFRTNFAACTALAASDILAYGAQVAQPSVDRLAQDREAAEFWNRSWLLSGQEGPTFTSAVSTATGLLSLAQAPSQLLDYIHHETTDLIASAGDALGITDENVDSIVENTLKEMAKLGPALLEPEFWEAHGQLD